MVKKLIDIDEGRLRRAGEILGAATMKETVNLALSEIIAQEQRRAHARRLATMNGLDLDNDTVMSDAWR